MWLPYSFLLFLGACKVRTEFYRLVPSYEVSLRIYKTQAMKKSHRLAIIAGIVILTGIAACTPKKGSSAKETIFELRVYNLADKEQEAKLDAYLEEAFLPGLKRNHIKDIGVFKHIPEVQDSIRQVFVLYAVEGLDRFAELHSSLTRDSVVQQIGKKFLQAPHDSPPYQRLEVILMKPFKDMPFLRPSALQGDRENRIYELRSYESPTEALYSNKVEMFNEGGEIELFESLGFNAVFYGDVLAGSRMPNLMYMTTFSDIETRDSLWQAFFESERWKKLISDPYFANNVNKADIFLLTPTSYSDY